MAKSSSVEDYWRQNNIDSLFKELTHLLVQRMPTDPAVAIVQYIQKKFPKSFKTSTENYNYMSTVSKTTASSLQLQTISSPTSDMNNDSISGMKMERRASNLSQVSGIVTIPTVGSAFTDLIKQDLDSSREAPELNLRKLIYVDRMGQQAIKMRKDIRSDHDIIEEELIQPTKTKANLSSTTNVPVNSVPENFENEPTHEVPSVKQLIEYKQQIRLENDRRLHRAKLAELAKQARDKERILESDVIKAGEGPQPQEKSGDDQTLSSAVPETSSTKSIQKPIVKSKEEEEVLNDEIMFQPRSRRQRERGRNDLSTLRSNTPTQRKQYAAGFGSSMKRGDENSMLITQSGVCKVCGSVLNNQGNQSVRYSQQISATPTARSFEPQISTRSVESSAGVVDDWFESASDISGPRQMLSWNADEVTPTPSSTNPFLESIFQPINDNTNVQRRPPIPPSIVTDDETKGRQSTTPRMSESDVFVRTPEPKSRRSSSPRNILSPVAKKHQSNTLGITSQQLSKTKANVSPSPTASTTERRMSAWSASEYAPDGSDEN